MKTADYLIHIHRHCQQLLQALQRHIAQQHWVQAQRACHDFCVELDSHFADEEQVLYPLYEQLSGQQLGPTEVMRYEHEQLRELMEALFQAVQQHDLVLSDPLAGVLQRQLQQHCEKEESILYPFCQLSTAQWVALRWPGVPPG
jgi:iron-sulfur cluster repair protein YtfE (RIC family)